jgi:hypothetical protein
MDEDETLRILFFDTDSSGIASQQRRLCCKSCALEALKLRSQLALQLSTSNREHNLDLELKSLLPHSVYQIENPTFYFDHKIYDHNNIYDCQARS